jgi:hypothetical protein
VNNLCIIHGDVFDVDWAKEVKMEMQTYTNGKFGDFQNKKMSHIAFNVIKQMKGLQICIVIIEDVVDNKLDSNDDEVMNGGPQNYIYIIKQVLAETTVTHELFIKTFNMAKLKEFKMAFLESSSNSK